jgi:hypothetical protein
MPRKTKPDPVLHARRMLLNTMTHSELVLLIETTYGNKPKFETPVGVMKCWILANWSDYGKRVISWAQSLIDLAKQGEGIT